MNNLYSDELNLEELRLRMKDRNFYGTVLLSFEAGDLVFIRIEQKCQPKDFYKLVENLY